MVSTRRSAATQAAHDSIYDFESPDKSKELQTRRQGVARKAAPNITTRRGWEETEPDAPVVKRRTLKKPGRRQTSKAVVEDEHEDDVPQDPNFYKNINDSAAGKTKARRATMAVREDDAAAEEQLLQESQQREGHVLAEEEEQNDPWSYRDSAEPSNDDDESHESHREVDGEKDVDVAGEGEDQGEETEESDGEDGSSDDDVREVTGSAVAPGSASQINNLENIASIDVISTDIVYIEPEPPDRSASTFYLNCDGLNTMINAMGKRGWMSTPGEWTDQLLRIEEESRTESEATKADNCTKLFHEILALWRNCKEMPKAPLLNLQAQFLREHSQSIRKNLKVVRSLTRQIKSEASESIPIKGSSRQKQDARRKQKGVLTRIHGRLMPALVLALKEALLLGGYSRLGSKPETISIKDGQFMACTLQFALRIVGFIDQLYGVVLTHLKPEGENEKTVRMTQRQTRIAFANHIRVLKPRILAGMNELKRLAETPILHAELAERSRRLREAQEERDRIIREKKDEQMMLFVASTRRTPEDTPKPRDEYYDRHGWRLWEDEVLLAVIRRTRSPNLVLLARQVPGRSLQEVTSRVAELRELIRAKYEAAGILPPKWCH
ncbi:hypothetical protein J3458_000341 [Metarhizium acridum]|uniref:uncharacterized protein n=1 Tax=Metarhizium acridum TaxID=92637 RepID=UPI001C6D02E1|nr:hypothetical protein J3458_000341 [Metarhizium acridum]